MLHICFPERIYIEPLSVLPHALTFLQLRIAPELLVPQPKSSAWSAWQEPNHQLPTLVVPKKADRSIVVEISQPELNATGILR